MTPDRLVFAGCLLAAVSALLSASDSPVAWTYAALIAGAVFAVAVVGMVWRIVR